jgi:hypothetical protein
MEAMVDKLRAASVLGHVPPPSNKPVRATLRVRGEIMGLIIMRTD